ncbi:VOC family protein [Bacillus cereus group sp. BfR-BA-01380]|uniref:VOC family protein n=1 Tax=Bacillus cereus group sp. BfR-BA-01380 TaxID=2920324 RepID=UPI001F55F66C|nr:hypothetical protein [Bacillus cereus group sp. BfR-BA-01380]
MKILSIIPRIYVSKLDPHLDFYKSLLDEETQNVFSIGNIDVARFQNLLLLAGTNNNLAHNITATIVVDSITEAKDFIQREGAEILVGPSFVPSGMKMIAQHPDDNSFEYIELNQE